MTLSSKYCDTAKEVQSTPKAITNNYLPITSSLSPNKSNQATAKSDLMKFQPCAANCKQLAPTAGLSFGQEYRGYHA